jgi:hypothetical protein
MLRMEVFKRSCVMSLCMLHRPRFMCSGLKDWEENWLECVLITQSILTMPKNAREKLPSTHRPPQSSKSANMQPTAQIDVVCPPSLPPSISSDSPPPSPTLLSSSATNCRNLALDPSPTWSGIEQWATTPHTSALRSETRMHAPHRPPSISTHQYRPRTNRSTHPPHHSVDAKQQVRSDSQ